MHRLRPVNPSTTFARATSPGHLAACFPFLRRRLRTATHVVVHTLCSPLTPAQLLTPPPQPTIKVPSPRCTIFFINLLITPMVTASFPNPGHTPQIVVALVSSPVSPASIRRSPYPPNPVTSTASTFHSLPPTTHSISVASSPPPCPTVAPPSANGARPPRTFPSYTVTPPPP